MKDLEDRPQVREEEDRVHTQVTAEFSPRMGRGYFKNLGGTWRELWIRNPFPNQMDMNGHKTL